MHDWLGRVTWQQGTLHDWLGRVTWLQDALADWLVGSCDSKAAFLIGGMVRQTESKVDLTSMEFYFVRGYWIQTWYTVYTYPHAWNNKKEEYQAVLLWSDLVPLLPPAIEWRRAWTWYTKSRKTKREGRKYCCFSWREMGKDPKPDDRKKKLWSPSLFSLFSACFRLGSSKNFAYVHAIALVKTSDNIVFYYKSMYIQYIPFLPF